MNSAQLASTCHAGIAALLADTDLCRNLLLIAQLFHEEHGRGLLIRPAKIDRRRTLHLEYLPFEHFEARVSNLISDKLPTEVFEPVMATIAEMFTSYDPATQFLFWLHPGAPGQAFEIITVFDPYANTDISTLQK